MLSCPRPRAYDYPPKPWPIGPHFIGIGSYAVAGESADGVVAAHRVLDAAQLVRIEATHRGFFYQHLFVVECMLDMSPAGTQVIVVENDEDVELVGDGFRVYIQVKTRSRKIQFSDVEPALERFSGLREEHLQGRRPGVARFALVVNEEPGPDLQQRMGEHSWPGDVAFISPGASVNAENLAIPRSWPTIDSGLAACEAKATLVPFSALAPRTLVFKLAGLAQYLATGIGGHEATRQDVASYFEQLVVQLQDFPKPPPDYRPQADEPEFQTRNRVRLITGASGSGKTSWASHAALHHPAPTVYFDVGELPESAVASSLARELVARFLHGTGAATLPQASGLELLKWASGRIEITGQDVIVVLDNVHHAGAVALQQLVSTAAEIRFVMLGQPWPGQAELEASLAIRAQTLAGWTLDSIAKVFAEAGCPVEVPIGQQILEMTAGIPLYVKNAAQLTAEHYSRDAATFVEAVSQRLNAASTAQESILEKSFGSLTPRARTAAAMLDLADTPLKREEALEFLAAVGDATSNAKALRELVRSGIAESSYGDSLKLHDAYRLLARDERSGMDVRVLEVARETLVGLLERSIPSIYDIGRFALFARLLAQTGRVGTLVTLATYEQFHQIGDPSELRGALESATDDSDLSPEDRFWALDALAFWEYQRGEGDIGILVRRMSELAAGAELGRLEEAALRMKKMAVAGAERDLGAIEAEHEQAARLVSGDSTRSRILEYNYALALYHAEKYVKSWTNARRTLKAYFADMNFGGAGIFGMSAEDVRASVPETEERDDDLRHAGDCLDLMARSLTAMGRPAAMEFLHAMKLYTAGMAWRSAVRAGQDVIDGLVAMHDYDGARSIAEQFLLPAVTEYQLLDLLIPVRAQYAVVLAWCGDFDSARKEMARLESYQLPREGTAELAAQRRLIEHIARGIGF